MVVRLAVWSGPRNLSTAWMRSWENRTDSMVVDEPLYAHYLDATGLDHPGREEVIASQPTDWRTVVARLTGPVPDGVDVFYQKHMVHHLLPGMATDWVEDLTNVLLIRDPREVLASYTVQRPNVTADDIGLPQQVGLYEQLARAVGSAPLVVDADDFLRDPRSFSQGLCARLGLDFTERMLHWPPGPRESDGCWAKYWYDAVEASTGFASYRPREVHLEGRAAQVATECLPLYERLRGARWMP